VVEKLSAYLQDHLTLSGDYEEGDSGCCPGGDWSLECGGLGLENAGVMSFPVRLKDLDTAPRMRSMRQPNLTAQHFAVGDCTDQLNLLRGNGEARAFADTEFGNNRRVFNHENVPSAVFPTQKLPRWQLRRRKNWERRGENLSGSVPPVVP